MAKNPHHQGLQISWTTVTYRSVLLFILVIVCIVLAASYLVFPEPTKRAGVTVADLAQRLGAKIGINDAIGIKAPVTGPQQAHFTAIDGTVKVKKASGGSWMTADYNLPLERGDVVQTSSEGIAKIVFADGTSYTVKQDSLIVVDDNSVNSSQQTQVSVQVTTGTVDLTTATFSQGSSSQVVVAGAKASLSPESSAQVRNDPKNDAHEILVKKGTGEVSRNGQTVRLTDLEKVSFQQASTAMEKSKELGPPVLLNPANMAPIFTTHKNSAVQFSWAPHEKAIGYRVRVSRNPYFSSTVFDQKVSDASVSVQLPEGAYYWDVQSFDDSGKASIQSERNRFTVIAKAPDASGLALELEQFVQHGHVIEIRGKTEVGARVMVNGQEVPNVSSDGSFQYLTPPLPVGENIITITAQNVRGGVKTQQKSVIIQ